MNTQPERRNITGLQWALLGLVLLTSIVRGCILFSTPLMPGMNGAYYLVQARSLLSHGALGIPDLPLTFCLQAALARLVQWASHWDLDSSILFAVKLADSVFPAFVALPVFSLVQRWAKNASAPGWIALVAAAVVALNAPVLSMVGDFEKNSLGLVWLAALLFFIHRWLSDPRPRNAIGVICFWGLVAVTHIAVFGASALFGGLAIGLYLVMHRTSAWRMLWPLLIAALAVGAFAGGAVLWKFDARRIHRFAAAVTHPSDYLTGNNMQTPGMSGRAPDGRMQGPPGGGPGFSPFQNRLPSLLFAVAAVAGLGTCWRRRRSLPSADICVVGACAVGVLVLTGPWVQGDKTMRFNLIAIEPAVLCVAFASLYVTRTGVRAAFWVLAALGLVGPSFSLVRQGGRPIVSEEAVRELRSLKPLIVNPEKTLIAARHGLEWWTAWTLHTHIAQSSGLRTADWQTFDSVFFLQSKQGGFPMMGVGPRKTGVLSLLDGLFRPGPPPSAGGMPPPPHFSNAGTPGGGGGPRQGGGPMSDPEVPSDSANIHDGGVFSLFLVTAPPGFVAEQIDSKK